MSLLDLIPGVSQAKAGLALGIGGAALLTLLGLGSTIAYYKYQNTKLENTILSQQNQLDNAKNVILQEKQANDTLVATINKLKADIQTIIHEQEAARSADTKGQAAQDSLSQKLSDHINSLPEVKDGTDYDDDAEKFLKGYNDNLECRNKNNGDLTACAQ